jgi:hypothetical protein
MVDRRWTLMNADFGSLSNTARRRPTAEMLLATKRRKETQEQKEFSWIFVLLCGQSGIPHP